MNNDKIIFDLNIWAYMSLINKYLLNNNLWKEDIVLNCIEKLKIKIPEAINTKNYLEKWAFPIIDQWKKFIWWYSDDWKNLFDIWSPVIIFWDHTRNLKYVDFPFILWADWVKVIKPKSEFIEKYFYYSLYSINIESKWYNRHYKYLMNWSIVIPNFKDSVLFQNKVLSFLETLEKWENIAEIFFDKETENQILNLHNKIKEIHLNLIPIWNKNISYIKQLKQAILQEAIEWKLTSSWRENNPNIESAKILLEKIQKEKEELVKQKKLKKQEKLKEISQDEIPFEIPENWSWCRLGEIIHLTSGNFLSSSQMNKNWNIPVFWWNWVNWYHNEYNTEEKTIVIWRVWFYCWSIHLTPEKAWITDNAFFTIFNSNYIYRDFLIRLLKWTNLKEKENAWAQPVISWAKIYPILIPLPPLEEQIEIVKKVDEMMKFCDELEKQSLETKENSENLMKSVLSEVFSR